MAGQIKILNTFIHNLSMEETLSLVNDTINNKEKYTSCCSKCWKDRPNAKGQTITRKREQ